MKKEVVKFIEVEKFKLEEHQNIIASIEGLLKIINQKEYGYKYPNDENFIFHLNEYKNSIENEISTIESKIKYFDTYRLDKVNDIFFKTNLLKYAKENGTTPLKPLEEEIWEENKDVPLMRSNDYLSKEKELPVYEEVVGGNLKEEPIIKPIPVDDTKEMMDIKKLISFVDDYKNNTSNS